MNATQPEIDENIRLKEKIYQDSLEEKTKDFFTRVFLEKTQAPIIETLKELKPKELPPTEEKPILDEKVMDYLFSTTSKRIPFLIRRDNQAFLKGKRITIDPSLNIEYNGKIFDTTSNVWRLLKRDADITFDNLTYNDKKYFKEISEEFDLYGDRTGKGKGGKTNDRRIYEAIIDEEEYESPTEGSGIIISDPEYLFKKLKLLLASNEAGNTGVVNEINDILTYLYETGKISKNILSSLTSKLNYQKCT